jgi:energy-converting hydrogenase Eha subunit E
MELHSMTVDLHAYRTKLPNYPLSKDSISFDQRSIWENYVYMIYYFIELLLYVPPYTLQIETASLDHPMIQSTLGTCVAIVRLLQAHLRHNPSFNQMPILIGRVVMLSGVTLAAYSHRDPHVKDYVADHIRALQSIGQHFSAVFLSYAEELKLMSFNSADAIQYLKTLVL